MVTDRNPAETLPGAGSGVRTGRRWALWLSPSPGSKHLRRGWKDTHGSSKRTAPALSKPPLPTGIETPGPRHAKRWRSTRSPSTEVSLPAWTTQSTATVTQNQGRALPRDPARGQSSAPALPGHQVPSHRSPGPAANPPAPRTLTQRNRQQEKAEAFPFLKPAAAVAGNIPATSNHVLTLNNLFSSANPLQQQAPPAGWASLPRAGAGHGRRQRGRCQIPPSRTVTDFGAFSGSGPCPTTARETVRKKKTKPQHPNILNSKEEERSGRRNLSLSRPEPFSKCLPHPAFIDLSVLLFDLDLCL